MGALLKLRITFIYTNIYIGTMSTISINYTIVFELKNYPEYKFTKCKKCINSKTSRVIKQVYNNGCLGYNIRGKFKSLTTLRKELVKIKKEKLPF